MANKLFEIQTWEIEDGTDLMNGQSKLKIWSTELEMYKSKKLKNGTRMFKGCYNLSYITDNFPSLTNGTEMFQGCIGLDTAFMDLSSLTNGTDMFNSSNTKINSVKQVGEGEGSCERTYLKLPTGLPNLETSERMFSTSYIRSFDCDMPKLTNGKYMFQYNKVLITFKGDITSLVDGTSMFENCPLQNFDPSPDMTYYNGISDLSSLAYGDYMFYGSKFSTINLNAGSLLHADHMFHFNKNLLQFYSNIASLVTGNYMFAYCENLETFTAPLWELMEGKEMFRDTNLSLDSLTNITATIRNRYSMSSGYLWASIDDLPTNIDRNSDLTKACMLRLKDKAWAVNSPSYSFNSQTIPQSAPEFKNFINGNYTITNVLGKYLCGTNLKTNQTNCVIGTFDDTNSIVNGDSMFYGSNIRNFDADLGGLTNANYMFGGCSDLLNFTGEVGTNHSNDVSDIDTMFNGCYSLQSVRLILNEATTDMPYFGPGWTQCSPYQLRAVDINGAGVYETSYKFANCRLLSSVHLFLPSVTEARGMFQECYSLTSFTSDIFSSLETACNMFKNCTRLKEFTPSHLSALTNGQEMFYYCKNLASFSSNLPNLTNGWCMFNSCTNLTAFDVDLPNLINGEYMFNCCYKLTAFDADLSSLTSGKSMFDGCTKLTSFKSNLSSLTNGERMFNQCKLDAPSVKNIALTINKTVTDNPRIDIYVAKIDEQLKKDLGLIKHKGWNVWRNNSNTTSTYTLPKYAGCTTIDSIWAKDANYLTNDIVNGVWSEHLPDLESCFGMDGESLIEYDKNLTTFDADLSSLTLGNRMFYDCTNLTSFNSNLSSLTGGSEMFYDCKNLTSFSSDLSSLTFAWYMFNGCSALTSFSSDLSSLTEGRYMFSGCPLLSFSSNLGSLTNGEGMFDECYLDAASMENIANTLPTTTNGWIDIRYNQPSSQDEFNRINAAITTIRNKGWTNGNIYGYYDSGGNS